MLSPGEVKIIPPLQPTYGKVDGQVVPTYKINFSIRGQGSYSVMVPREGFTAKGAEAAMVEEAQKIVDLLDTFK